MFVGRSALTRGSSHFNIHERIKKINEMKGEGLKEDEKENARPGYPGEKHAISFTSGVRYNFNGPGTKVDLRMKRGDPPINDLDSSARKHDIAYFNFAKALKENKISRPEFLGKIKQADAEFKQGARKSKDAPILGKISANLIGAKEIAEDLFLPTKFFSGAGDPAHRLKKIVKNKKKGKNKKIEIFPQDVQDELIKEQEGGFAILAPLAYAALSTVGGFLLDKVYDHFFNKKGQKGGSRKKKNLSKEDKIEELVKRVPEDQLLHIVDKLTK